MIYLIVFVVILYLIGVNVEKSENIQGNKKLTAESSEPETFTISGLTIGTTNIIEDTMSKIKKGIDAVISPVKKLLSRANRNNNPGNLRYVNQVKAIGKDSGGYATFKTVQDGWEALEKQINLEKSRGHTLSTFIYKYAPTSENVTAAYLDFLVKGTGKKSDTPLSDIDTATLAKLIAKYEGYVGGYLA